MERKKISYGEIYMVDFGENDGSVQNGRRPALIIQDNTLNATSPTTIVAAITSAMKNPYLPSHIVIGKNCGLKRRSIVLLEQTKVINQCDLGKKVGVIEDERLLRKLKNAIRKTYGLWNYSHRLAPDVRCLCHRCLSDYMAAGDYYIRRLNPGDSTRDHCDKCNRYGYDYIFFSRNYPVKHVDLSRVRTQVYRNSEVKSV